MAMKVEFFLVARFVLGLGGRAAFAFKQLKRALDDFLFPLTDLAPGGPRTADRSR